MNTHFHASIFKLMAVVAISLTLTSCKNNSDQYVIYNDSIIATEPKNIIQLSLPISETLYNRYEIKQLFNDTLFFGLKPMERNNQLHIINILKPDKSKIIKFEKDQLDDNIGSFYVQSLDSILLFLSNSQNFAWANSNGNIFSRINIADKLDNDFEIIPFIQNKPIYKNGKIFFNLRSLGLLENSKYLKKPQLACFDLNNNKITQFGEASFLTKFLNEKEVNTDFYSPYYILDNSDRLLVLYPFFPYVLVYDTQDLRLTGKHKLGSNLVKEMSRPTGRKIHSDSFRNAVYRAGITTFCDIHFHNQANVFSIVLMHPFESQDQNGRLKDWDTRKSSLLVLDAELNLTHEFLFKNGNLLLNASVPTSNGLLFSKHIDHEKQQDILHYYNFLPLDNVQN